MCVLSLISNHITKLNHGKYYWSLIAYSFYFIITEDEQLAPLPAKVELKSNWDDEDVDENDIKDSWEDDDDDDDEPAPVKPATEKAPPKKAAAAKAVEKKGKAADVPKEAPKEEEPLDPISEKLRLQR